MITGFNHTSFTVADMDKSVRFWTEMLGFKAASVSPRQGDWQEAVTGVADASLMVAHLYGHGHHVEFIQYLRGAIDGTPPATGFAWCRTCLPGGRRHRADMERTVGGRRNEPRQDRQCKVRSG